MMGEIGYSGSLARTGNLKRPLLRKEWSFFFDCITRAFGKKCTNWDAIPIDSLQIGYSLLYDAHFDFAILVLNNIGEKMTENRGVVYFARFYVKKGNVGDLLLPASIQQFLQPQPQLNSEPLPSTSQRPKAGGRTKHRAFKAAKPSVANDLPNSVGTSRKKRRANRPISDENSASDENESIHTKKRKLVAAYLFDGLIPDSTTAAAPEIVTEDISANATVPEEARAHTDDNAALNDDFLEPILQMDNEENIEAHPAISVCDTKDVAADQATLVLEESMATHTEILSVTNQVLEVGDEVDQEAKSVSSEKIVENAEKKIVVEEAVLAEEEVAEKNEAVTEKVLNEAAQSNVEVTAENVVEEAAEPLVENVVEDRVDSDSHDHTSVNSDHADSDESIPFLRDPTAETVKENQNATEAHYRDMYYSNWSGADCIFSKQRTADFVAKSAKEISNPELLTHLKATIVQVKSLHNRFDETHKDVIGLRNDIVTKELALKTDRAKYSSMIKDQVKIKQRLSKVESNQDEMSTKIDSIAASLELLTSVLIPDDVKKGERVPKDKCKRTQTLRRRDDATDGGSKDSEFRSKNSQEQGRLRSNSAKLTNSERVNSGVQSSSKLKNLAISANPITDEEIAAKLFLEEHGGEATVEDIDAELQILAEEHKKKVEAGTYKQKAAKAPRRKEKGIIIKENVNSQQSL
ncbi:hypothetical protein POM88_040966 [Heracleum sosnowskyi]|uniref:Uncharacterized protein n=1 Tax=Heracleum sosnowskyi TaxID=360622 RepID=A0AAD8HD95_9APIA|nr:hypothetical protein POM88_040966 [Heracleum sosnowskyi]